MACEPRGIYRRRLRCLRGHGVEGVISWARLYRPGDPGSRRSGRRLAPRTSTQLYATRRRFLVENRCLRLRRPDRANREGDAGSGEIERAPRSAWAGFKARRLCRALARGVPQQLQFWRLPLHSFTLRTADFEAAPRPRLTARWTLALLDRSDARQLFRGCSTWRRSSGIIAYRTEPKAVSMDPQTSIACCNDQVRTRRCRPPRWICPFSRRARMRR